MKKRITLKPLETVSSGRVLFLCCFLLYALIYCGRLNYSAAISCGAASYLAGLAAKHVGWQFTILIWAVLAMVGAITSFLVIKRWLKFKRM